MDLEVHVATAPGESHHPERASRTIALIVAAAFAVRLIFVLLTYRSLPLSEHFEQFGAEMGWTARSLATGHSFSSPFYPQTGPTALVPPLFPVLLAGLFRLFGVYTRAAALAALTCNALLSSLTAAVIFYGVRSHLGMRTARAAAWLWVLYPYAVYYSAVYLWDCALTSLLFAGCFFLAWTGLPFARAAVWAGWGVLMGVTVLSNPSVLSLTPVLLGYAIWRRHRAGLPSTGRALAAILLLCAVLAPWCVRNVRVMGEPVLIRDGFWGEFYAGNCGDTSQSNPGWTHPASNPAEMQVYQRLGETGYMAWKRELSIQQVRQYPVAFLRTSVRRALRFWTGYWSFSRAYLQEQALDAPNVPFCTLLTAVMLAGTVAIYRRSRSVALLLLGVLAIFPLPYYITHASMDYRQPIEPVVVTLIAYGARALRSAAFLRYASWRETPSKGELAVA